MAEQPLQVRHYDVTDAAATLEISGAIAAGGAAGAPPAAGRRDILRVFHISDSHVTLDTPSWRQERVSLGLPAEDPIAGAYADTHDAVGLFEAQVAAAMESGADMLIHTGDLLNVPCAESVEWVRGVLDRSGLPYLFTCGNHDWCYEGLGGDRRSMTSIEGRARVRQEWTQRRLLPLFCHSSEHDPHMWSHQAGGLTWVGIDNSTCQVSRRQRLFFEATLAASPSPVVLLVHVPLATEELKESMVAGGVGACVDSSGRACVENGYLCGDESAPPADPDLRPDAETLAFLAAARGADHLVAVLSGHIHSAQVRLIMMP
jgi:3',5'-cyclic AMP phosphodiesterase CpdA